MEDFCNDVKVTDGDFLTSPLNYHTHRIFRDALTIPYLNAPDGYTDRVIFRHAFKIPNSKSAS